MAMAEDPAARRGPRRPVCLWYPARSGLDLALGWRRGLLLPVLLQRPRRRTRPRPPLPLMLVPVPVLRRACIARGQIGGRSRPALRTVQAPEPRPATPPPALATQPEPRPARAVEVHILSSSSSDDDPDPRGQPLIASDVQLRRKSAKRLLGKLRACHPQQLVVRVGRHNVFGSDLCGLLGRQELSDVIINVSLHLIAERSGCTCLSSFLFEKIAQKPDLQSLKRWRQWSHETELLFIPVNIENVHWALIAVDFRAQTLTYLDSLNEPGLIWLRLARSFLQSTSPAKTKWRLQASRCKVPQQTNLVDCGVFVIKYADLLSQRLPLDFGQPQISSYRRTMACNIIRRTF